VLRLTRPAPPNPLLPLNFSTYRTPVPSPQTGAPVTTASGDASDTIGRPVDNGQLGILDPDGRAVGLHLYDGLLKVIPMEPGGGLGAEMFNCRLEELNVIDAAFLAGCPAPTVALLYEDAKHARHIKTYAIQMRSKVGVAGGGEGWCVWQVGQGWGHVQGRVQEGDLRVWGRSKAAPTPI
jgi:DNA damage-binding protein 1